VIYQPGKTKTIFAMPLSDDVPILPDDVSIPSIIHVCPIPSFSSAVSIGSLTVSSDDEDESVDAAFALLTQPEQQQQVQPNPEQEQRVPIPSFSFTNDSGSAFDLDGSVGSTFTFRTQA